jgi:hypothetical protein
MEKSIVILKSLLLPILEKDSNFCNLQLNETFWQEFSTHFSSFEIVKKSTYNLIYTLQLAEPERVLGKLPQIFQKYLKEMAELYVIGKLENIDNNILENKNFQEKVSFLKTMKNVIVKIERERFKKEISKTNNKINFEVNENEIKNAVKKVSRDQLKKKFTNWDFEIELVEYKKTDHTEDVLEKQTKLISLSWIKYAFAACVIFGVGIVIWQNNINKTPNDDNPIVNIEKDTVKTIDPISVDEKLEDIAYNETIVQTEVQMPSVIGFAPSKKNNSITIIFKDGTDNIKKLERLIIDNDSNVAGDGPILKAIKNQLNQLKSNVGKYEFNGKEIVIYTDKNASISVLSLDGKSYFIKRDSKYFYLYFSKIPLEFKEVKSVEMIEQLEKITFDNE